MRATTTAARPEGEEPRRVVPPLTNRWSHHWQAPGPMLVAKLGLRWSLTRGRRQQRVDAQVPPRRRSRPSTPDPGHGRRPGEARRGSVPRFCRLTTGDAGCTQSSSSRTPRGDPATVPHYGSARAPHQSPADDQPTGHPAAASARQQRLQPSPVLISQIMTIVHPDDLPHPSP